MRFGKAGAAAQERGAGRAGGDAAADADSGLEGPGRGVWAGEDRGQGVGAAVRRRRGSG